MTSPNRLRLLVFSLLAVGGWAQTLPNWSYALTPLGFSGLLLVLAGGLGLAFGVDTNGTAAALAKKITGNGSQPKP